MAVDRALPLTGSRSAAQAWLHCWHFTQARFHHYSATWKSSSASCRLTAAEAGTCGTSSGASPPGAESEAHRHSGGLQLLSSHLYQAGPTPARRACAGLLRPPQCERAALCKRAKAPHRCLPNAMQQAASSRAARRAAEAVIGCSLVTAVLL